MKRKPKILMVQTANMNLGDNVIADCNCRLLRLAMFPRDYELFHYNLASRDVAQIRYADAVIFAGGIVKSTNEKFWQNIVEVLDMAEACGVPVFMSGIGAEPIQEDEKGANLKRTLNLPCLKLITCRDDIACLQHDYLTEQSSAEVREVFDTALWCPQTYRQVLKHTKYPKNSKCIGIGIIRHKIFADYGNEQITKEMQTRYWCDVIENIEKRGYEWKLFTNGDTNDEAYAEELLALLGRGSKYPAPRNANALMQYINSFGGVIGGRMHSNIIAYALGIPSVGFIWNKKLRFWGEKIGHPERFMEPEEMDGAKAVELLSDALHTPCKATWAQRMPSLKAYRAFVKYIVCRELPHESIDLKQKLCAVSLGCIEQRYKQTNSVQALNASLAAGYVNFQTDIRLSANKVPVLVKRWHEKTYKMLGIEGEEGAFQKALSSKQFLKARYFNRFEPLSLEKFFQRIEGKPIEHILFSVGLPSEENFRRILEMCEAQRDKTPAQIIFVLERCSDIAFLKAQGYAYPVMYLYLGKEDFTAALEQAQTVGADYVAFSKAAYDPIYQKQCDAAGLPTALLGYERLDEILYADAQGVRFIGTGFYDVQYLERLLHD